MRRIGMLIIGGSGMLLIAAAVQPDGVRAQRVDDGLLDTICGGIIQFCKNPVADPAGLDCTECTSNGNGGSVKCLQGPNDQTFGAYVQGQFPPMRTSCDEIDCPTGSGSARTWPYSGNCSTGQSFYHICHRQVTLCNSGPDFGASCP